tara:strand:- start:6722 stop:7180 length:459 start_codon:yes stop_codon:yes gene_type:complete
MSEETKKKINILPSQFEHSDFARQDITITADHNQTPADFLNPNSYSSIAEKIQPRDKITVLDEGMTWQLELLVVSTARNWVRAVKTNFTDITAEMQESRAPEGAPDDFFVDHRGRAKWCVIRRSDNEKLHRGIETQEDALKQMADYIKSLGL